jgi:hypothetical protein
VQAGYKEDNWADRVSYIWEPVKKKEQLEESWKGAAILSAEAKESPLLEAVTS